MADKTSTAAEGEATSQDNVATSGTIAAGSVKVQFDDTDDATVVFDCLEKCKVQIQDYYNRR